MPPNLLPAIAQWAHTPLETLLAPTEQEGGQCLPPKAIEQGLALHRVAVDKVRPAAVAAAASSQRSYAACRAALPQVPAYAQLVAADRAPAMAEDGAVQLCESWDQVPLLTKDAFVQFRPLAQRCAGGQLGAASFVHQSSGSSGEPALWARSLWDELDVCTR